MTTPPSPATTATPGLPLFYGTPLPVRFPEHRNLGLRADGHYRFAAASPALPLTVPEFAAAGRVYPIVFAQDEAAMPLAVTGLAAGRNLFVSPDGAWRPGCYVPAYLRRYPFIGIEIEPRYCAIAAKRIQAAIDATALFNEVDPPARQASLLDGET